MAEPEIVKMGNIEALAQFAGDGTPEQRRGALTVLIASKYLPKNAEQPAVEAGRDRLLHDALNGQEPSHRMLAIAEVIRLTQVVKRWLPNVVQHLEPAFDNQLPSLKLLTEADDRLNVARACSLFQRDWLPGYLARSIAEEEQGEKARAELVEALFSRVESLADAMRLLGKCFADIRPSTESAGDTVAKRLTRTLGAMRVVLMESDREAGRELGKVFLEMISGAFLEVGRPQDDKAIVDLSHEVLLTVHDMVRTRISVVAEPSMYQAVAYCRQLCGGTWPDGLSTPLNKLTTDVCEALLLLGRQGRRDQTLLGQLDVLCKYPERARVLARELAARHPELDEDVREWLERGRARTERIVSSAALEAAASNADAAIGLALQAARLALKSTEGIRERLVSSLEIYEPSLVAVTGDSLDRVRALAVQVEQAASLRSLDLIGVPGEDVEFSPKFFEVIGGNPRQTMLVRQPAVVKTRGDGIAGHVILRGLVE